MNISRVLIGIVFTGVATLRGTALCADDSSDANEIVALENTINAAWLKHDTATISPLIADDFQSWSFKGARRSKTDLLRSVERSKEIATTVEDPVVRMYGDAAVYTARIIDGGQNADGASATSKTCLTSVLIRRGGKWQVVATHESLLPDGR